MLSKSDFLQYLDNPLHLWAYKHTQAKFTPDPGMQFLMRQGYKVEDTAIHFLKEKLNSPDYEFFPQKTVSNQNLRARADMWVEELFTRKVRVFEIKSSTRLKQRHIWDAAFQYYLYQQLHDVESIYIVHVNPHYRLVKDFNPNQYFEINDVTDDVLHKQKEVETKVGQALVTVNNIKPPLEFACNNPKTCPCPKLCFKDTLSNTSIYYLNGKLPKDINPQDIKEITHISEDIELTRAQQKQVESAIQEKPIIDKLALKLFVNTLDYPLWFLDYETVNFAIPKYQNHAPQQHLPFQYSLHKQAEPGADLLHYEYLHTQDSDPVPPLLAKLETEIGDQGSVLVWYKHFELGRNRYMAELQPKHRSFINQLNNRVVDLMDVFRKHMWVDYRFKGSTSIKNVLPVIVPELTYSDLEIGNGGLALLQWYKMVYDEKVTQDEQETIATNLLEYCKLDTLAMVKIFEKVQQASID